MKQRFYFFFLTAVFGLATSIRAQTPTVVTRLPTRNTVTAPITTDVGVNFSQPIEGSTAAGLSVYSAQAGGKKKGAYTTSGTTVTFNPTVDFKPGERVSVTVPAAVRSSLNTAAAPQVHEFTTAVSGTGQAKNFRTSSVYAGSACFGFAMGDVDGDGDLDIVENNQYGPGGKIFVLLNGGNRNGSNTGVFSAGTSPNDNIGQVRNIALGDMDGDGDLDIVALSDNAYIFSNGGDTSGSNTGVFTLTSFVKAGRRPSGLALGDVDGDGDLDIVTSNFEDTTVSVRLNGGDNSGSNTGTFKNGSDLNVGYYPAGVALGDVDGDGDLDMLVSNNSTAVDAATVKVCLNGGDAKGSNTGVFSIAQKAAVDGIAQPYGTIAIGDIDGDGDLDFALATYDNAKNTSMVSVRLNGGDATGSNTGVFSGSRTVAISGVPYSVAFGDADADGDLDLAVSTLGNKAFVRLNGGDATGSNTGVFSGGNGMLTGYASYNVGMADVDGDGDLDLLTADYGDAGNGSTITIGLNQPPAPIIDSVSPTSGVAGTVVTLTGSNLADATILVGGKDAIVSVNTGNSLTFKVPVGAGPTNTIIATTSGGTSTKSFTVLVMVTAINPAANTQVAPIYSSPVKLTLTEPITYASANRLAVYSAVAGGKKSGQAYPFGNDLQFYTTFNTPVSYFQPGELVSISVPPTILNGGGIGVSKRVYQFTTAVGGTGRGNFQPGSTASLSSAPIIATVADVDSDGDQDIIVATTGSTGSDNSLSVRLNKGDGTFQVGSELTLPAASRGIRSVAAADLDADGDLDIVTANAQTNNLTVLLNNSRGSFIVGSTLAVGTTPSQVIAADVDGDGYLDLLTVNKGTSTVSVRLNTGYGYFSGSTEIAVGTGVNMLTVGDIDADGDLDILTANSSENTVSVRLNNGTGTFSDTASLAVGNVPINLALGDIDADGDLDLVVANSGDNTINLLHNDGLGSFGGSSRLVVGTTPTGLVLADINADGRPDILTTNSGDNTISVLRNIGAGTFNIDSPVSGGGTLRGLVTSDIDKDGDIDLLLTNSDDNTVSVRLNQPFAPTLSAFTPASGTVGTSVTITGTNLAGTTGVTLNGLVITSFSAVNSTTLTFTVPTGATSGLVAITTPGGTATSASSFIVVLPTPTIASLTPGSAVAGSGAFTLIVTGTGFVSGSVVNFGNTALSTTYDAATQLTTQVPANLITTAGSLNVSVSNPSPEQGGTSAAATFTITAPAISTPTLVNFLPANGLVGTTVTVTGTNLMDASALTLNGISVSSFTVVSSTTLTFVVPVGATSGLLTITTPGGTATSSTSFTVLLPNPVPVISNLNPTSAMAGSSDVALTVTGTGYINSSIIQFNGTVLPTTVLSTTQLMATIPATALTTVGAYAVIVDNPAPGGGSSTALPFVVTVPVPTISSYTPTSGGAGTLVTVTGTNLTGATQVRIGSVLISTFTVVSATSLTLEVPLINGIISGFITITTPAGTASSATAFTIVAPAVSWTGAVSNDWYTAGNWTLGQVPNATISAIIPTAPSGGRFPIITTGTVSVRNLTINSGASLKQLGGTLAVTADLTNNGTFQPMGGTVVLGNSTPSSLLGSGNTRFWNLTVGSNGVQQSTSANVSVQRLLTLDGSFSTNGNSFTLESNANLTAMVVNNGSNVVNGDVTVQCYISPALNPGLGYRHFSSPISNATVGRLATASFAPVVNPAYNASTQPGTVTPYPTVYGYDQSRLSTATNNSSAFNKGWFSPAALSDALTVGQGYTVNLAADQTLSLTGPLNNGIVLQNLTRNGDATAPDAGWSLVGNPFPAPLNYALVPATDRPGLDAAIYVFESSSQYGGSYRASVNGVGGNANSPNSLLSQGQGFFVRVSSGQTSGTLTLRNNYRLTTYTNPAYLRTAETRPLVQLDLQSATGTDPLFVYFESNATAGLDSELDAVKLPNTMGLNVSAEAGAHRLAINALPVLGATQVVVPLVVSVPAAGSFSFQATQLLNLATTPVYLRDKQTGTLVDLAQQPSYQFTVSSAAALNTTRFELVFSPQSPLATVPAALAQQVAVFPNPARAQVAIELPLGLSRQPVAAALLDALGRVVRQQALPAGLSTHTLPLTNLTSGVYSLHLTTEVGTVVKKLVVE